MWVLGGCATLYASTSLSLCAAVWQWAEGSDHSSAGWTAGEQHLQDAVV